MAEHHSHTEMCSKCNELARLLLEARDALPAISLASARLHNVDLTLADRIEKAIEPWKLPDCDECQDFNPCPRHRSDEQQVTGEQR